MDESASQDENLDFPDFNLTSEPEKQLSAHEPERWGSISTGEFCFSSRRVRVTSFYLWNICPHISDQGAMAALFIPVKLCVCL